VDFFNNQFNPATDTLLVRGVFANPQKEGAARLRPGMFVRVKLWIGQPYKALLVPDRAIVSKMGKRYVYVADPNNRVREIPVTIGQLQENGLRVIKKAPKPPEEKGKPTSDQAKVRELTDKDRVIVTRLLEIHPEEEIVPEPLSAGEPAPGKQTGKPGDKGAKK
jgi:multidrug efflux pump subunit AcrA (membrane-fusion protein)